MSETITELEKFLEKLNDYEPGIINIIQYYTKTHTFKYECEIRYAVELWHIDREECIEKFGNISHWDTSKITDMSKLFYKFSNLNGDHISFTDDISRWDVENVWCFQGMFNESEQEFKNGYFYKNIYPQWKYFPGANTLFYSRR